MERPISYVSTLAMDKTFIQSPKYTRKMATTLIWICQSSHVLGEVG